MNCDQLLLIFERENGPKILGEFQLIFIYIFTVIHNIVVCFILSGAKREFDGGVVYMVKPNDGNKEQFIPSNETKKFLVPVIDFLQSKIVFEKRDTDNYSQAKLIHSCDEPHSVICKWLLAKFNLECSCCFLSLFYFELNFAFYRCFREK